MILSAGLTPAWQQILVFDRFRPGEVNRAAEVHWCLGQGVQREIAVHHLGPSLVLAWPADRPWWDPRDAGIGVPLEVVETGSATRVCTTVLDRSSGTITELVENGRPVSEAELDAFWQAMAAAAPRAEAVVLIGTLPAGAPQTYYRRLLECVSAPAVLDFRGQGLTGALDLEPCVVKPNREELAQTVGRPGYGRRIGQGDAVAQRSGSPVGRGDRRSACRLARRAGRALPVPAAGGSRGGRRQPDRLRRRHGRRPGLGDTRRPNHAGGGTAGDRRVDRQPAAIAPLPVGPQRVQQIAETVAFPGDVSNGRSVCSNKRNEFGLREQSG